MHLSFLTTVCHLLYCSSCLYLLEHLLLTSSASVSLCELSLPLLLFYPPCGGEERGRQPRRQGWQLAIAEKITEAVRRAEPVALVGRENGLGSMPLCTQLVLNARNQVWGYRSPSLSSVLPNASFQAVFESSQFFNYIIAPICLLPSHGVWMNETVK